MAWVTPKTNWKGGDIPSADDFNRIEGNINEVNNKFDTYNVASAKKLQADQNYTVQGTTIEGETTGILRVQKGDGDYSILEIKAPPTSKEATLSLMRQTDPSSGGPEFVDIYTMNYGTRQAGIRIQSRGTGQLSDFVIDFNDGSTLTEVMRVKAAEIQMKKWLKMIGSGDTIIDYRDTNDVRKGYIGRIVSDNNARMTLYNNTSGCELALPDTGGVYYNGGKIWHEYNDGAGSGLDADLLDGKHYNDIVANARADSTKRLVVEVSSVAPSNPVAGQIWFDSANKKFKGFDGAAWL